MRRQAVNCLFQVQRRPRKATISSRAFAALTCGHNFLRGKRDGNPWGEALALMRTPACTPAPRRRPRVF
jgi:type IV secretory pathway VirB4 component